MRKLSAVFVMAAALGALTASPVAAAAQGRDRGRGREYARVNVQRIIERVENRSDVFRRAVDRQLDRSRLNGSKREDRINEQVKQYDRTVDELRAEFSRRDSWMETRGNVERVLRQANDVNRILRDGNLGRGVESEWSTLRRELNTLAQAYDLQPLR